MAKVKCIGCERIMDVKALEAHEGFAACPSCHALFDVTSEVVRSAPRGAAEFWSHGELKQPPGVEVIGRRGAELANKDDYRSNARKSSDDESILLTCSNQKFLAYRIAGPLMVLMFGGIWFMLHRVDPTVETSMKIVVGILCGLPVLAGFYLSLVGFLNRVRIHVNGERLRIDQGPLPFPHEKSEIPVLTIARLCAHQTTWTGKSGEKKTTYSLTAWLRTGRNDTFLDSMTNPAVAMFLQQRIAAFLDLDSRKPVDLIKGDESS